MTDQLMTVPPRTADARPPVLLTIAGSDPSGGAGIQADLKTFTVLGGYGCAVITALTAQNTHGVTGVHVIPADFVREQLVTLVADIEINVVKIGMLANSAIAEVVAEFLLGLPDLPVVLDPVMVATSGDRLLDPDAEAVIRGPLMRRADLITPNLPEAAALVGGDQPADVTEMRAQVDALLRLGARRVLLKGGHLASPGAGQSVARDLYGSTDGRVEELDEPWIATRNTHGTGCTLSAAIAAEFSRSHNWLDACSQAKRRLTNALREADSLGVGSGHGPVAHLALAKHLTD